MKTYKILLAYGHNKYIYITNVYALGYSDFHNLMRFTSKQMPNNIL
jgi:hypothetical protein